MGIYLPVPIVAAAVAFFYGRSIRRAWLSGVITFACVLLGGILYAGIGQIAGVVISALIIFIAFSHPAQRRAAEDAAARERDASMIPNEEDT